MMDEPATQTRILSVGEDHLLLNTRALVLKQAGYEVCSLFGRVVTPALLTCDFYFLLLCHTVPAEAAKDIYRLVRSHEFRPVVVRLTNSYTDFDCNFDVICDVWRGPGPLLEELIRIRRQQPIKKIYRQSHCGSAFHDQHTRQFTGRRFVLGHYRNFPKE